MRRILCSAKYATGPSDVKWATGSETARFQPLRPLRMTAAVPTDAMSASRSQARQLAWVPTGGAALGRLRGVRKVTEGLWAEQDRHPGDRHQLFRTVAQAVDVNAVLYPGSWCDIAASFVWPSVTYVDADRRAARFFDDPDGVREIIAAHSDSAIEPEFRFLHADYANPPPLEAASFDLLVSRFAGPVSRHCTEYLRVGGMLLANPSHGDVALASIDPRYELAGVIHSPEAGYRFASEDLQSYLVPKAPVEDIAEQVERTGCGIAYTRPAHAYFFRRVR